MKKATFNLHSLGFAFQAVKENHGCAGVDGVTIERFEKRLNENLKTLEDELTRHTYFPLPLMKILVEKKNGEPRNLYIPTVRDRVIQKAFLQDLEYILEKEFEDCSFAYRKGRSVRQAIYKIKEYYEEGYQWVVDADIDAFFDNVDHGLLLTKFKGIVHDPQAHSLIEMWLKSEIWDGSSLTVTRKGIPQGSPISPIMANLFLDELDEEMMQKGYSYVRYADDFVILCKTSVDAKKALQLSKQVLGKLLLELDEEEITSFDKGFKYLGVNFLRSMIMKPFEQVNKRNKLIFYPEPFNIKAYLLKKKRGW